MANGIKVSFKGNKKTLDFLKNSKTPIQKAIEKSLQKITLKGERITVQHISKQDLGWEPLNKRYQDWKIKRGFSENILVSSSTYFQSITSYVKDGTGYIGVKRGVPYSGDSSGGKSGAKSEVADIAFIMEYGSEKRGIPERPLWRPSIKELQDWVKKENPLKKEIQKYSN